MTISPEEIIRKVAPSAPVDEISEGAKRDLAIDIIKLGRASPKAIPDYDNDLERYSEKVKALRVAFETGIFFNAQLGSESGLLHIRNNKSDRSLKVVSMRFDINWQESEGSEVGTIRFNEMEKRLYPALSGKLESIRLHNDPDKTFNALSNDVHFSGAVSEKLLLIASDNGTTTSFAEELNTARFKFKSPSNENDPAP